MNTYCKKMNVLSIYIVSKQAVSILLKKKYPGTISLHLLCLSIFKTTVLNEALACLIFMTSNLLQTTNIKNTGITTERVKITQDATVAICSNESTSSAVVVSATAPSTVVVVSPSATSSHSQTSGSQYPTPSDSTIFIKAKNVRSKQLSIQYLIYALNLNCERTPPIQIPNLDSLGVHNQTRKMRIFTAITAPSKQPIRARAQASFATLSQQQS